MGELIAFKSAADNARLKAPPIDPGTIVIFTGIWHERLTDQAAKPKRAACVAAKRSGKSRRKTGTDSTK